ncbi:Ribonuclease MC [Linum perenne]
MITQLLLQLVCCFDYFVMALQWAAGVCSNPRGLPCISVIPNEFTSHGYWPTNNGTNIPPVQVSNPLNYNQLWVTNIHAFFLSFTPYLATFCMMPGLYNEMTAYWPQLFTTRTNMDFWLHEYNHHGIHFYGPPTDYFDEALNAYADYDPMLDLEPGFIPSNTVTYNAMLFHQALANNPILNIFRNPAANNYILREIKSCYANSADATRINCPGSVQDQLLTCGGPNGFILFPTP